MWFTDQYYNPPEIEDKINITLVINKIVSYKKWQAIQFNQEIKLLWKVMDFYLLLKNMGKNNVKNISKNLSSKYSQKPIDHPKRSATDAVKTASKRAFQKTAKTRANLIVNKIDDKIASVSKNDLKTNEEMLREK